MIALPVTGSYAIDTVSCFVLVWIVIVLLIIKLVKGG